MLSSYKDYRGLALMLVSVVAALWLALTNQLKLYIHPRYIVFTAIFAGIALLCAIYGAKYVGHDSDEHNHEAPSIKSSRTLMIGAVIIVCTFGAIALVLTKPASLTSATATQRGINAGAVNIATPSTTLVDSPLYGSNDYSRFTIKDWAGLLVQTSDADYFANKKLDVTGFVVADQNDGKNMFYVSRFVVTCCAVDARPIGLPVYYPGWKDKFGENQWVEITGEFVPNPSLANKEIVAIKPTVVNKVSQPEQVYEY